MKLTEEEVWREQCRRQLERDVMTRIKYGVRRLEQFKAEYMRRKER